MIIYLLLNLRTLTIQEIYVKKSNNIVLLNIIANFRWSAGMKKNDKFIEEDEQLDEELLDFEFEDLPDEGVEEAVSDPATGDEVIELVDVIEEGDGVGGLKSDEIDISLDEDELDLGKTADADLDASLERLESSEEAEFEIDLDESELNDLVVEESEAEGELELEDLTEPEGPEERPEIVVDDLSSLEEPLEKELQEGAFELTAGSESKPEKAFELERPAEAESHLEAAVPELQKKTEPKDSPSEEVLIGIFEEKIETIVREVVADVVEKVARETMVSIAEKVIQEAIEALKQSLESTPPE